MDRPLHLPVETSEASVNHLDDMKPAQFIGAIILTLSQSRSLAVNPTVPITTITVDRGFTHVWALEKQATGITAFTIDINPKAFLNGCQYRGGLGAPASFHVSLCADNTENFKGVTATLGRFEAGEVKFRISFQVPSRDLLNYHIEFQGETESDGKMPRLGNGMYIAALSVIKTAKITVTQADLDKEIETLKREHAEKPELPAHPISPQKSVQ